MPGYPCCCDELCPSPAQLTVSGILFCSPPNGVHIVPGGGSPGSGGCATNLFTLTQPNCCSYSKLLSGFGACAPGLQWVVQVYQNTDGTSWDVGVTLWQPGLGCANTASWRVQGLTGPRESLTYLFTSDEVDIHPSPNPPCDYSDAEILFEMV